MITGIGSYTAISALATQGSSYNGGQQRRLSMGTLSQALLSGNLAAAQQAYSTLSATYPDGSNTNNPNSPLAKVGQALQAGNLAAAQSAFPALNGEGRSYAVASNNGAQTGSFASMLASATNSLTANA